MSAPLPIFSFSVSPFLYTYITPLSLPLCDVMESFTPVPTPARGVGRWFVPALIISVQL